ncbi:hypothetical protein Ae201684P_011616 [Aphanomyces euteiches]|uniref:Uncharacterized protein n=1 Tax=Aphanomyces euteiches TaxID=100861 RepID=A0A6G0XX24_9STRA|nr:hypothetical protein Ae201684_000312 [Aphanomyces euteiches]KAH9092079.1 hypothetical protein Ae201684P_011616 [Aphanomyces euteiches]
MPADANSPVYKYYISIPSCDYKGRYLYTALFGCAAIYASSGAVGNWFKASQPNPELFLSSLTREYSAFKKLKTTMYLSLGIQGLCNLVELVRRRVQPS